MENSWVLPEKQNQIAVVNGNSSPPPLISNRYVLKINKDMNTPKQSDLIELESLYISAKLSFKENENIDRSVYRQDDIEVLFKYILSSPWCNRNYDPREAFNLKSRVESATLPDIQSLLTYFARCEHFCDGAWANIIKKDELASCIERAKELVR